MMLQEPWHLLALSAVPVMWWLSLPARPKAPTWTPHLAQWRHALQALRRRPPRRSRWRFWLLATAATAATFAWAQPVWPGEPGPERLVIVLDGSASMAARDAQGGSAFAAATAAVTAALANVPDHVDVTLLRAGGPLRRRHGASARAHLDFGEPGGALAIDLVAVAAAAANEPRTVVWTCTDGQGQTRLPDVGALTVVPRSGPNAAIIAVRLVDAWPLPNLTVAVDVVAHAGSEAKVELRREGACADLAAQSLTLAPGVPATATFEVQRLAPGGELRFVATLAGDILPDDDTWRVQLPPLPAPRIAVLVDADAGPFAAAAADALADEVDGEVVPATSDEPVGLLLVDGGRAALQPGRVRALTFGSQLAGEGPPEAWRQPSGLEWARTLPMTAGIDLSELVVHQAWRGLLPPGEPFLWANEAEGPIPLAVFVGDAQLGSVHFAFRLQDSNLPLLPAFPQLLRRAFVRCYGTAMALQATSPPPAAGEQDLTQPATAPDRPLPSFATKDLDLAPWCLLLGLCALALRTLVR
jgi:hypothetical protein